MIENLQDRSAPAVGRLNRMSRPELADTLMLACHSRRWAERVGAARLFPDGQHRHDHSTPHPR